jgi:hypothetical protein
LLKAVAQNGDAVGAALLPGAAAANRSVFFDDSGRARSVAEIYRSFASRVEHNAADYARLGSETAARPGGVAGASRLSAMVGPLRALSAPVASVFNAMMLTALRLLGGRSGITGAPALPEIALNGATRRRDEKVAGS